MLKRVAIDRKSFLRLLEVFHICLLLYLLFKRYITAERPELRVTFNYFPHLDSTVQTLRNASLSSGRLVHEGKLRQNGFYICFRCRSSTENANTALFIACLWVVCFLGEARQPRCCVHPDGPFSQYPSFLCYFTSIFSRTLRACVQKWSTGLAIIIIGYGNVRQCRCISLKLSATNGDGNKDYNGA